MADGKPDLPDCAVSRVVNGYIVRISAGPNGFASSNAQTYVARNRAELVRVLDLIAVREKLDPPLAS